MRPYEVTAHNTATESENRIHDDEVARRFGFTGALVPGVDVYAYLVHPVVETWGRDWLTQGTAEVAFAAPIYDGHPTVIEPEPVADGVVTVRALADGVACAAATFVRSGDDPADEVSHPIAPQPARRPDATPGAFGAYHAAGALPTLYVTLDPSSARGHLDAVGESLPLLRGDEAPAHPAWLLRRANDALAAAVRLGPWIHVGSRIGHIGPVHVGDTVEVRSRVRRWWERAGHRFVAIDVALFVDDRIATTIDHTAIYEPRPPT